MLPVHIAIVAAVAAAIALVAGAIRPRRASAIMGVAGAATLLLSLLAAWRGDAVSERSLAARYEESGAPLALVDGTDLAVPAGGWDVVHVSRGWGHGRAWVTYDAPVAGEPGETAWVEPTMAAQPGIVPCGAENGSATCLRLGRRDDGAVIRGRREVAWGSLSGVVEAWVDVDGGRWTIDGVGSVDEIDVDAAVMILRALEPVEPDAFAAAT